MKKHIFIPLSCLFLIISCQKTDTINNIESISIQNIESTANDFFKALGTGDTTLMKRLLTHDFEMFEHDEIWNTDSLLSLMPNTIGREWSVEDLKISQDGDLVHLYYFNRSIKPKDRSWYESMLMKASGKELKIKFIHSTKLYLK